MTESVDPSAYTGPERRQHPQRRHDDQIRDVAVQITGSRMSLLAVIGLAITLGGTVFGGIAWTVRLDEDAKTAARERAAIEATLAKLTDQQQMVIQNQVRLTSNFERITELLDRVETEGELRCAETRRMMAEYMSQNQKMHEYLLKKVDQQ